jgi:hypothetical protein
MTMFREDLTWLPRGFEFLAGLPEARRRKRPIVALQAFLDDSGTKGSGKVLLVGGLIGTAEAIARVADAWDRELRSELPLPISYFKAYEAQSFTGEFANWRRKGRDQKVQRLASVLDCDDLVMLFGGVDLLPHRQTEVALGTIHDGTKLPINQPYLLALMAAVVASGMETLRLRSQQKVEIVVDEHNVFKAAANEQYERVRAGAPKHLRDRLPSQLLFRDDREFVMLQAADLLMGNMRMVLEKAAGWPRPAFKKLKLSRHSKFYDARFLGEWTFRHIEKTLALPANFFKVTLKRVDDDASS